MSDHNKELLKDFLLGKSKNKKQSFIYLKNRLADLILAENKVLFDIGRIKIMEFPDIISSTRNYYIHYDESIKDRARILSENEISIYNRALLVILEFHLYSELGFTRDEELMEKLYQRWGNVSTLLSLEDSFSRNYEEL